MASHCSWVRRVRFIYLTPCVDVRSDYAGIVRMEIMVRMTAYNTLVLHPVITYSEGDLFFCAIQGA